MTHSIEAELARLLNTPEFRKMEQRQVFAGMRNQAEPDWLQSLYSKFATLGGTDSQINEKTGQPHTVESMVQELRERVKLDGLTKQASVRIPLSRIAMEREQEKSEETSKKEREEKLPELFNFIEDLFSSHRGFVDTPAVIQECRSKFGNELCHSFSEEILEQVKKMRDKFDVSSVNFFLPSSGQPEKGDSFNTFTPLFEHVGNM